MTSKAPMAACRPDRTSEVRPTNQGLHDELCPVGCVRQKPSEMEQVIFAEAIWRAFAQRQLQPRPVRAVGWKR